MDDFDVFMTDPTTSFVSPPPLSNADIVSLAGDNNSPPVQASYNPPLIGSDQQKLGSGISLPNIAQLGTDVGTAVGTIQRQAAQAKANYNAAQGAAASGNSLSTWWLYASTTDKLMVGLAIVGIIVAFNHEG